MNYNYKIGAIFNGTVIYLVLLGLGFAGMGFSYRIVESLTSKAIAPWITLVGAILIPCFIGGFVTAWLAKGAEIINAAIASIFFLLFTQWFLSSGLFSFPGAFIVNLVLPIPIAICGGWVRSMLAKENVVRS